MYKKTNKKIPTLKFPCRKMFYTLIPAIKFSLALELYNKYNFSQEDIAKILGVTQAAVSKYTRERVSTKISAIASRKNTKRIADEMAKEIFQAVKSKKKREFLMCESCYKYFKSK